MSVVTKKEMKKIFADENLTLGFPNKAANGSIVTDYAILYGHKKFDDSDLKKFIDILPSKYPEYTTIPCGYLASTSVKKQFML